MLISTMALKEKRIVYDNMHNCLGPHVMIHLKKVTSKAYIIHEDCALSVLRFLDVVCDFFLLLYFWPRNQSVRIFIVGNRTV